MNLYPALEHNSFELLMDIIQNLIVYFQCSEYLLIHVLEGKQCKIRSDLAPASIRAPPVRCSKENDELRPFADFF